MIPGDAILPLSWPPAQPAQCRLEVKHDPQLCLQRGVMATPTLHLLLGWAASPPTPLPGFGAVKVWALKSVQASNTALLRFPGTFWKQI